MKRGVEMRIEFKWESRVDYVDNYNQFASDPHFDFQNEVLERKDLIKNTFKIDDFDEFATELVDLMFRPEWDGTKELKPIITRIFVDGGHRWDYFEIHGEIEFMLHEEEISEKGEYNLTALFETKMKSWLKKNNCFKDTSAIWDYYEDFNMTISVEFTDIVAKAVLNVE